MISDSYEKATMSGNLLFGRANVLYVAQNKALECFLQPSRRLAQQDAAATRGSPTDTPSKHHKARVDTMQRGGGLAGLPQLHNVRLTATGSEENKKQGDAKNGKLGIMEIIYFVVCCAHALKFASLLSFDWSILQVTPGASFHTRSFHARKYVGCRISLH